MWKFLKQYLMPIYVSPLDLFLKQYDETHPRTKTQRKEVEKYRRQHQLRDEDQAEQAQD